MAALHAGADCIEAVAAAIAVLEVTVQHYQDRNTISRLCWLFG
jgi:hypothetical protein